VQSALWTVPAIGTCPEWHEEYVVFVFKAFVGVPLLETFRLRLRLLSNAESAFLWFLPFFGYLARPFIGKLLKLAHT
jgi:hypothetical protein